MRSSRDTDQGKGTKESAGAELGETGMETEWDILWHIAIDFALVEGERLPSHLKSVRL